MVPPPLRSFQQKQCQGPSPHLWSPETHSWTLLLCFLSLLATLARVGQVSLPSQLAPAVQHHRRMKALSPAFTLSRNTETMEELE